MFKCGPLLRPLTFLQLHKPNMDRRAFISSWFTRPNFCPKPKPRYEARIILAKIPKKLSAHNIYVKENFGEAEKDVQKPRIPTIFTSLIKEFNALPPEKMAEYEARARTTQEAHREAVSKLTPKEKAVLLADKRKRLLKKAISSTVRKIAALKREFSYPTATVNSFAQFFKEKVNSPEVAVLKGVAARSGALASMWKSLSETEREEYKKKAAESKQQAAQKLIEWRQKMANADAQSASAVGQIDDLCSGLKKLRRKLRLMEKDEELEKARKKVRKGKRGRRTKKSLAMTAWNLKVHGKPPPKPKSARGRKKKSIKKKTTTTADDE